MVGTSEQKTETTNGTWNGAEGWGQVVLDHTVIEMQSGFACSRKYSVSDGLPHLRPFNIGTDGEINLGEIINIPKDYRGDLSHYELVPGDVLFNNTNSVELVGKTAIVHDPLTCAFSNRLTRLRIRDKTRLEPAWLALCLHLLWKRGFFEQHCNKWIGQAGFNPTKLANVEIPLPHVDIQRRIVARIEALMAEVNRARELLEQMHQGVSLLIDAALGEVFNDSKIDEWTNKSKLGDLVAILANQVDPRQPKNKLLPHVGVDVIESATCRLGKYQTAEEDAVTSGKYLFRPGVVLYSKIRPPLRKVALANFEGLCSADIYPLSIIENKLLPRFLMWSLVAKPFTKFALSKSGRARMPKINRTDLLSYDYRFPNRNEQQHIVSYLDSIQSEMNELDLILQKNVKLIDQIEQSILERAFRGEL